jgi:gliding motility-associated lipoprotein GldD
MQKFKLLLIVTGLFFAGCEQVYTPKPKGFNRFDLPEPKYTVLKGAHPFVFEYSAYSEIKPHKSSLTEPHWLDISYPDLHASVELTYKDLHKAKLEEVLIDAHKLTKKHGVKAYSIDESLIKTNKGYTAAIFRLEGEIPSQYQFFVTDSVNHFLRGALYFRTATKNDSLAPAIQYISTDMEHLLNTLEWNKDYKN